MKHQFLNRSLSSIIFLCIAIAFGGCKENILVNSKISPSSNAIGIYDTSLACITHTYFGDSAITSTSIGGVPVYQALGGYMDPYFGTMIGATFFQVIPADVSNLLYDDATIDSAILVLPYSGFTHGDTGNTSLEQTYQVFYLADSLAYSSTYYSFSDWRIDELAPMSDPKTIKVHSLTDSLGYNVLPENTPGLRIKLKNNAISRIKGAQTSLSSTSSTPLVDFMHNFYGVCVRVADTRKTTTAIPYFRLDGSGMYSQASILVYYHPNSNPDTTLIESYYFDKFNCSHFNSISRSYSHYPVNALYQSTAANDQIVALQNMPGASIDVVIPGISKLPAGIINKAELQLCILPGYGNKIPAALDSQLLTPDKIYPTGIGNGTYPTGINNGLDYILNDYTPLGSSGALYIMDGYFHNFTRGGKVITTYTIDIPREVMGSIRAKNDTIHLHINGTSDFYGAYHLVAGGGNYPDTLYRPKLFVVYSKLSN